MRTEFLCISVLRVASGPMVKLAICKSALNPPVVYSTDRSKAVVPVLVLLFFALWFILRGDLFYVLPCVVLFLCFSVLRKQTKPNTRKPNNVRNAPRLALSSPNEVIAMLKGLKNTAQNANILQKTVSRIGV